MTDIHSFDFNPRADGIVPQEWLAENNRIAAAIPRGGCTPAGTLRAAVREYNHLAQALGGNIDASGGIRALEFETGLDLRGSTLHDSDGVGGVRVDYSRLYWDKLHSDLFGAGRALERAIQEARFGRKA
jgi:hypothetical protein